MPLPKVTQTISDGGLGLAVPDDSQVHIAIGVASTGTINGLSFHRDADKAKAEFQDGPLVDKAVYHLQVAGGSIGMMRINASIAGVASAVTTTRAAPGTSTGTMTVAGAPHDAYDVKVEITKAGTLGAGEFKYTLDGGDNYSPAIQIPGAGTYAIPNTNLTLTFGAGAGPIFFAVGDLFTFTCTAPGFSSTDVNAALDALRTTFATARFGFVHLVGAASTPAGAATIAATVDVKMTAEENVFRYLFAIIECPEDTDANIITAFNAFSSTRVGVAAGFCELVANGRVMKRNAAWPVVARIAAQDIRRDVARTRQDKEGGPLAGVTKLYRDEFVTEALDAARFITLRTYAGKNGFFVTNGRTMAAAGSDFTFLQFRRLMDRACTINYGELFNFLNDDVVRIKPDGTILEIDARSIETKVNAALKADLTSKERVTTTYVVVTRDNNILSTQTLKTKVRIVPKGYAKFIETDIGFANPAIAPVAPAA
jgi:hypothetical protein